LRLHRAISIVLCALFGIIAYVIADSVVGIIGMTDKASELIKVVLPIVLGGSAFFLSLRMLFDVEGEDESEGDGTRPKKNTVKTVNFFKTTAVVFGSLEDLSRKLGFEFVPVKGTDRTPLQHFRRPDRMAASVNFQWYVVAKAQRKSIYKIVGLHKRDRELNGVYIVGVDSGTGDPFLIRVPPDYIHRSVEDCDAWTKRARRKDEVVEV
jgi:hypothetical protein